LAASVAFGVPLVEIVRKSRLDAYARSRKIERTKHPPLHTRVRRAASLFLMPSFQVLVCVQESAMREVWRSRALEQLSGITFLPLEVFGCVFVI
jgi:hypothetical protein